jgi:hypothetical protein
MAAAHVGCRPLAPALDQARLEQANAALVRVFGLAHQMLKTRAAYYDALNHAQRLRGIAPEANVIDVTPWVQWFVQALPRACVASQAVGWMPLRKRSSGWEQPALKP